MTRFVKFIRCSMLVARSTLLDCKNWTNNDRCGYYMKYCFFSDSVLQKKYSLSANSHFYGHYSRQFNNNVVCTVFGTSLAFLGFFKKDEEEKEPELITTIKRSILLIQKQEYKKAEQMLHVALHQAQSLQNEDGITYIYDVMANLAFEVGEYDKAEKLFTSVMQRVLSKGVPQDDLSIVHMSLKIAKILESKKDYEKAELGYQHCGNVLKKHIDAGTEDKDILSLWALNLDWYSHMLLAQAKYSIAMKHMKEAYELCLQLNGKEHEQTVVLLNDLGSINFNQGNYDEALDYLLKAAEIGEKLPEMEDLASIHVNLGNIYIKKGMYNEAKKSCSKGWKLAKSRKSTNALEESKACLQEVEKLLKA